MSILNGFGQYLMDFIGILSGFWFS